MNRLIGEFSVLQTALSALSAGFETMLVEPGLRGIDEGASAAGLRTVEGAGGKIIGRDGEDWERTLKHWSGA